MAKNTNPYRAETSYNRIFAAIQAAKGIVTNQGLVDAGHPTADVTVVLSPRMDGESKGDPRGNMSAQGHKYAMAKLKKVKGEPQRLRLRWLAEGEREARVRVPKEKAVKAVKQVKVAAKAKAKTKSKAKVPAKKKAVTATA